MADPKQCPGCNNSEAIKKKVSNIEDRLERGDLALHELRESIEQIKSDMAELLDIFRTSKHAVRFLGWVGKGLRWVVFTSAAIGAIWAFLQHGSHK